METIKDTTSIVEVLRYIVANYGAEIYKEKQRLSNLIADLYRGEEKKKRVYRRAIMDDSLSVKVHGLSLIPLSQRKAYYQRLIFAFSDLNFYSEDFGKQVVDGFVSGLNMPVSLSQECEDLIKKAMEGDAVAQNRLGVRYYDGKGIEQDYVEAVKWYRKSAEQGNSSAQNRLGVCYYKGNGVEQDYVEAVKWQRKSAEQGNDWGQYNLANCYYDGKGIEQDYSEAVKWFRKSAEQGNSSAQNRLGVCYYKGNGVEQNYSEAVKWQRKSAEQGNDWGQYNLANCYFDGKGVEQDDEEGEKWMRKSAEQGNEDALAFLEEHGMV